MLDWKNQYSDRITTACKAIDNLPSKSKIFLTSNCSVPKTLLSALIDAAPGKEGIEIYQGLTVAGPEYVEPGMQGHLKVNTIFCSSNVRKAVNDGRADFTPMLLSEWPQMFRRRRFPVDYAFAQLSPPNEEGYCSFGIATGVAKTGVESADQVIAEVNEQMLPMPGDTLIHMDRLHHIIPVDYPTDEMKLSSDNPSQEVQRIAANVAELIPDGATLQIGIGEIPGAVLKQLFTKSDLGVHSETFSDTMVELVEAGVVNGSKKTLHPGKLVAGFLLGSREFYRWASNHPMVELYPTEYVNHPFTISRNTRMAAINAAIEVDLTGQVCADSIGTMIYSGVGGQMDFIYGASQSEGGLPIIAMTSTVTPKSGPLASRIVPTLRSGAGVTTTRNHVHYVATEYGIVNLYGQSIRQRAQSLISIAHPDFQDSLRYHAKRLNYI